MPGLLLPETPLPPATAELRTIRFSQLLDRNSAELTKLILACQEVGFFYLDLTEKGTGKMLDNLDNLNSVMQDWFAQDLTTKTKTETVSNSHGYKPTGTHAGVGKTRDGWEALKLGRSELAGRWALPDVVEDRIRPFSDFQSQCHYVTKVLLDCISSSMGLKGSDSLHQYHRDDAPSKSSLFFLHYPPLDNSGELGQNMHTDIGSLTLLFAPQWGLQVLCPKTSSQPSTSKSNTKTNDGFEWRYVAPRPGHAIINIGDTLRFLTGNKLRSALHRALPLDNEHRYATAYFLRPSDDAEFEDLDGNTTSAVDWYLTKNKTYEKSYEKQSQSVLVGGLRTELKV